MNLLNHSESIRNTLLLLAIAASAAESTPGVTATRGIAWSVEGKPNYRNDANLKDRDPGAFKMYAVPLPKP
jgi:hypothetical protein